MIEKCCLKADFVVNVPLGRLQGFTCGKGLPGKAVLSAFPRKAVAFLTLFTVRQGMAQEFRRLRTATRGFAP